MDWTKGWRDRVWSELNQDWDVVIIGGGITGAGILRQCVHSGLKVILVEADDFASGTSSRSSKLVHGGMRYLRNAQVRVTLESVTEREYLLKQGRGLISRLGFIYPILPGDHMPGWVFGAGLVIYDLMAHQWSHRSYDNDDLRELCPSLTAPLMHGGFRFFDAQTDDARLVLRLLRESVSAGGLALNYARVESLLKTNSGQVCGVVLHDTSSESDRRAEVKGRVVINATGAWADTLRREVGRSPRLRPIRGSHLIFPYQRLPLTRAITFLHPLDGRAVFAIPWEGVVIFGTTDVDQDSNLVTDPCISAAEVEYLLTGLKKVFPAQELTAADITATFSGIRPVVNTGKVNPSKESREHVLWDESGLLTVSGGKLTTFRIMARDALIAVRRHLGHIPFDPDVPVLDVIPPEAVAACAASNFSPTQCLRLLARYGPESAALFTAPGTDLEPIAGTIYSWAELRQAAREEGVVHLDDLLLRRLRLGLLAPTGGLDQMSRIRAAVQPELGWDDVRWQAEEKSYAELWRTSYRFG
ncbi:MAG: glycerol-3-phosphate dehydrogenase/oxidase [Anaerolineales bacterium]|jgi:glycerol-3-phosphate dehydrogenase